MSQQNFIEKKGNHLIGGIVVLTIGVLFLLRNFDFLSPEMHHYIFSWKTLLIGIGILNLVFAHNKVAGFILIAIGTFFWLPEWFDLSVRAGQLFWPLVIIGVGIMLLFRRNNDFEPPRHRRSDSQDPTSSRHKDIPNAYPSDDEYVDDVAIFSGSHKIINSQNFRGGKMTAIFGGSELNLTRAQMAPGRNILNVFFMFGGSEIQVPPNWKIVIEATPIFGGFSDKRRVFNNIDVQESADSVLIIRGVVLFGGAEIKSY